MQYVYRKIIVDVQMGGVHSSSSCHPAAATATVPVLRGMHAAGSCWWPATLMDAACSAQRLSNGAEGTNDHMHCHGRARLQHADLAICNRHLRDQQG